MHKLTEYSDNNSKTCESILEATIENDVNDFYFLILKFSNRKVHSPFMDNI